MKRRDFLKTSVVAGVALSLNFEGLQAALSSNTVAVEQAPDLVAVMEIQPTPATDYLSVLQRAFDPIDLDLWL